MFRVIKEETHAYKKDNLYVLMFIENDKYGIDVANSHVSFGRIHIETKQQVDYAFEILNSLINDIDDYLSACEQVSSLLKCGDFREFILRIHTNKREIDKMEMYLLISVFAFKKTEALNGLGTHVVRIFAKDKDEPYGEFVKGINKKKYRFIFFV